MSPLDRAGQLVMTSVPGTRLDARSQAQLRALRPGGVILFAANYRSRSQLRRLDRVVQIAGRAGDAARPQLLVSIDQEGGIVKRIVDAPPTRSQPQLGATDRVSVTRSQGRMAGQALRSLGVNMNLAPVADLDVGPRRVMGDRSYGRSSRLVSRHVGAFVDGLQGTNVAASVKHFPGFGAASVDSDDALATITRTQRQLRAVDLMPFRAALERDADTIMISHGVYRAIDRRNPASASPAVYRLLRTTLGYDGVAITDSLHAAGFLRAARSTPVDGCVRTIAAGADIALLTGSLVDALRCRAALVRAVRSGTVAQARIDEAALRVLRLKSRRGLLPTPSASAD
jgi:beta-N-acetylhexosaminidase